MRKRQRDKRTHLIIGLCAVLVVMAVGFAAFSQRLQINGTSNITSGWDVHIKEGGVSYKNAVDASSTTAEKTSALVATFACNLITPGKSTISYDVVVENKGSLKAKLDSIELTGGNEAISVVTDPTNTSLSTSPIVLGPNDETTITVIVSYNNINTQPVGDGLTTNITAKLNFSQTNDSPSDGSSDSYIHPSDLISNVVTTGDGLYADSTENGRYIYRGGNPNNYIIPFKNIYKIYVNGDGGEGMWGSSDTLEMCQNNLSYANNYYEGEATCELNPDTNKYYTKVNGFYKNSTFNSLETCETNMANHPVKHGISCTATGDLWRIVSIESDGTMKIAKNSSIGSIPWDVQNTRNPSTSTYCVCASFDYGGCNSWAATSNLVGTPSVFTLYSPTGNPEVDTEVLSGTVITDASLNTFLNTEYYDNSNNNINYLGNGKENIVSHNFYVGSSGTSADDETVEIDNQQEKMYVWNGKVGLIQSTDYLKASTNSGCVNKKSYSCGTDNYLKATDGDYWTITPFSNSNRHGVWFVCQSGSLEYFLAYGSYQIRPAVYLSSTINLKGDGTSSSPYLID